jgi:hypothetical protein
MDEAPKPKRKRGRPRKNPVELGEFKGKLENTSVSSCICKPSIVKIIPPSEANDIQRAERKAEFLRLYKENGQVHHACKAIDISYSTPYSWAKKDAAFAKEWADCKEVLADAVEGSMFELATRGEENVVVDNKGGEHRFYKRNATAGVVLLKMYGRFREGYDVRTRNEIVAPKIKPEEMTTEELVQIAAQGRKLLKAGK